MTKKTDLTNDCACVLSHFSRVQLCDPMDRSLPGSMSLGFSRQEYWSGSLCPPPGDLPDIGMEPTSPMSPALQVVSALLTHQVSPCREDLTLKLINQSL